ncbi:hypothetical protein V5O48_001260 [Marasmius crinis-equi]|uniref:Fork-head domain-containing protein n=1 Tax=Marasmius crinis-equi TaxID=585013 RepID=A0ABR3FZL5_9AGAR
MSQPPPQGMNPMMPDQQPDMNNPSYYPPENDLTGGLPINLDSLRDGPPGSKPFYPYSTLIRYAIKGSPNQKLLLEDIYYAIESRFPYFRTAPNGWKNSVRHNLSLNPCFEKVPRPLTDRGKGSYWTVNDNVDPRTGVHRVRKKKTKGSKNRNSEEADVDYHPPESFPDPTVQQFAPPPAMHAENPDANRQPANFTYAPFDPNFAMMQMRFPGPIPGMPMPMGPDEGFPQDENGNIDWRLAWHKEIGHLQHLTQEQEKTGADPEWYRMMLYRVRTALMPPQLLPDPSLHMQPGMVPQVDGTPQQHEQPPPQQPPQQQ